jgi:hypothetical protein
MGRGWEQSRRTLLRSWFGPRLLLGLTGTIHGLAGNRCESGANLHSRESLDFIYQAAAQAPLLSAAIRQGELSRGWWTPPLGPHDAWLLGSDDIEAPLSLQALDECRGTPISVEWTVPFGPTFFHLGVHNLPVARAREIWSEIGGYAQLRCEKRLRDLLALLSSLEQVLIVFNHPLWDETRIGQAEHRTAAREFLSKFKTCLHALELNGLRPWSENRDVFALDRAVEKPVISGGDRHAIEPNALLNLTNAGNFDEFAEDVDVLRTYERHANGWCLWSDRVFYLCDDGCTRSLTTLFGERTPAPVALFVGAMQFAAAPRVRRFLREAFASPGQVAL